MPEFIAYIANCTVAGMEVTKHENSWVRDTINFDIGNRTFTLRQNATFIKGNFRELTGRFCETSVLTIENVEENELDDLESDVHRLCWLLSFGCLSNVVFYRYDYVGDKRFGKTFSAGGTLDYFRPSIDIRDGAIVKSFIEQTFNNYKQIEQTRKLSIPIHYLLLIESNNLPTEAKLALIFTLLENLKSTFAQSKNIPYIKGFFRKGINPNKDSEVYKFRELLKMMFEEVGFTRDLSQVINIRNEIIHSGLTQLSDEEAITIYDYIHDLCREYILRLLGYRGDYLLYSSANRTSLTI